MRQSTNPAITTIVFLLLLLSGCEQAEQKITPIPDLISDLAFPVDRTMLAPHVVHLLEEAELGRLAGADSTKYSAELAKADKVLEYQTMTKHSITKYVFILADHREKRTNNEDHPILYIYVQKKFGHIVGCEVNYPTL